MTSYAKQAILGPVISPLVSKDKGDFSNRANCAGAQFVNNVKTLAQDTVVIGGAVAGMKAVNKSPARMEKVAQFFDKIVKKLAPIRKRNIIATGENGTFLPKFKLRRHKLATKLLNMSKTAKVASLILVPTALALGYITNKGLYKMGQIDQKYTDKAKVKEHQNNVLD